MCLAHFPISLTDGRRQWLNASQTMATRVSQLCSSLSVFCCRLCDLQGFCINFYYFFFRPLIWQLSWRFHRKQVKRKTGQHAAKVFRSESRFCIWIVFSYFAYTVYICIYIYILHWWLYDYILNLIVPSFLVLQVVVLCWALRATVVKSSILWLNSHSQLK